LTSDLLVLLRRSFCVQISLQPLSERIVLCFMFGFLDICWPKH